MSQYISSDKRIGYNIRLARVNKKLTQEALSAQLQVLNVDISRSTLAKIEVGIRHVSVDELLALKQILDISFEDIFTEIIKIPRRSRGYFRCGHSPLLLAVPKGTYAVCHLRKIVTCYP